MQCAVGKSMWTWRVSVLRRPQLPESLVDFSSGTSHQRLYVYTVVYAGTQLEKRLSCVIPPRGVILSLHNHQEGKTPKVSGSPAANADI